MHEPIFDYAPHLIAIDQLAKQLHDACLYKRYDEVPSLANDLVVEARMVRAWAVHQLEDSHGNKD
jgi:hypothetical protein